MVMVQKILYYHAHLKCILRTYYQPSRIMVLTILGTERMALIEQSIIMLPSIILSTKDLGNLLINLLTSTVIMPPNKQQMPIHHKLSKSYTFPSV